MAWIQGKTELFLSETEVRGHHQLRLQGWDLEGLVKIWLALLGMRGTAMGQEKMRRFWTFS